MKNSTRLNKITVIIAFKKKKSWTKKTINLIKQGNLDMIIIKEETKYKLVGVTVNEAAIVHAVIELEKKDNLEKLLTTRSLTKDASIKKNSSHCNKCGGPYKGYFSNCSILPHLLNNSIPSRTSKWKMKSIPTNVLKFRDSINRNGVSALETLPSNIKAIKRTRKYTWKIKHKKLVNIEQNNWIQFVNKESAVLKNLEIFQDCNLHFQINREIMRVVELVMYYNEEDIIYKLDNMEESYYIPLMEKKSRQQFFCILCYFGFRLKEYLIEYKTTFPHSKSKHLIETDEKVECRCCKICVEMQEHLEHDISYRWNNPSRTCSLPADFDPTGTKLSAKIKEVYEHSNNCRTIDEFAYELTSNHGDIIEYKGQRKFIECSYKMEHKENLQNHLNTNVKSFQFDICNKNYNENAHIKKPYIKQLYKSKAVKPYECETKLSQITISKWIGAIFVRKKNCQIGGIF